MLDMLKMSAILLFAMLLGVACANTVPVEPVKEFYRGLPYHAPTTQMPPIGIRRISANYLKGSLASHHKPVLIDVYGAIFREESLDFDGAWLVSTPRKNIPGSVWLPNVGEQELKPVVQLYFDTNLIELTAGDKSKSLVFYCIEDCWMAWNAAKRAREWGYSDVMWFREGVDGWKDIGGELQVNEPINLPVNE
ncbi:MAG TPA: PQQ-dependent catabolism-associated CXXCW motif protein [Cycloclasticus sp.]|jgi:PQQ-dependent catabolism-associated CXXCW motif protein|nr:PQQ-dependent catabolism-associated CXXCW motif protein [Cycloclasticus sp.]HIL93497.1 PQQ-dependent catabolism-associated CXXCW motif protein [Cycloclasticus sp.]